MQVVGVYLKKTDSIMRWSILLYSIPWRKYPVGLWDLVLWVVAWVTNKNGNLYTIQTLVFESD